ncbi:exopolysaccharide biosynthesis GT4 family glycosyltransferase EpsE [Pseudanabaena sp. FACHB-2040]|uniref:exopolysaccharide biosynthesis GT4 family glycosyltransferase EpsE n=1 Tax=Pseudanabaena sp. FACHB-2040 TaxID=2692859 RepID=UPI001683B5D7|nr:exopolysaccharide biosynthesis GT4 family glycosyltransferase EpsE [Pseudanabaena sp. FACHB-2040]MBD2257602.1 glycosyltransferase family 4 protein [Pseudanabaena sp. FACHB-2040]
MKTQEKVVRAEDSLEGAARLRSPSRSADKRIGYLIPEFPGQTHNFFWRESQALKEIGLETVLISTRKPPKEIMSASWAEQAQKRTTYLLPLSWSEIIQVLTVVLSAGPRAWLMCTKMVLDASDMTSRQKLRLILLIPFAAKLVWLSQEQDWSHIHVHSCADAANIAMLATSLSKSRLTYSLTLHNPLCVYGPNQAQKWGFSKFAVVITQKIYQEVVSSLRNCLPQKIEVCPMGVDLASFRRDLTYAPYDGSDAFRVFSCGRLNPCKGYEYLIRSISLLRSQGLNVRLEIAGEDEQGGAGYRQELERLIGDLDLQDSVTLLGAVSEEAVKQGLKKAHVFVLASLEEPLGVATMEAMAMNVPVVVTNGGGVSELVDDGQNGILVPPENSDAIAQALLRISKNQRLAIELGQAAREKVVQSFSYRRSAQAIASMLEQA